MLDDGGYRATKSGIPDTEIPQREQEAISAGWKVRMAAGLAGPVGAQTPVISVRWIDFEGRRLRYLEGGNGPPVMLLHGFLGGSLCWRFTLPALARQFRVVAPDLPGVGLSQAEAGDDCGIAAQAGRVFRLIQSLGLGDVHVIGCSFGGAVALHLALLARRLNAGGIRSLALAAPVNPWSRFGGKRISVLRTAPGGILLRMAFPYSDPVHGWALRRLYGDTSRIPLGTLEAYRAVIFKPGRARSILSALRKWKNDVELLRDSAGEIDVPVLLVWGDRDRAVDPESSAQLQRRLPACECHMMAGVGHLPFEEAPEEFNRMVLNFLARCEGATGQNGTQR